ncbi:MAG: hypothetical protein K2K31_00130 [Clostridia bacterium]|nr:hypothetical protein [Clostridia bacterium]
MKKFSIVFMSICVTFLATLFCACTFKKPEAQFSKNEHIVSIGEQIDLDEYLQLTGVEKNQLTYRFSDSSLFEVDGHKITAKASGKSKVYAFYEESNLASMQVVVRKQFDAPSGIHFDDGSLVWNTVTGWYEGEELHTVASSYTVEWTYTGITSQTENGSKVVYTNALDMTGFKSGTYNFKVKANTHQYFDESNFTNSEPVYYGYMDQIKLSDFDWNFNTGVLTWKEFDDAKYSVRLNGALLLDLEDADLNGLISENSVDLSRYLTGANSGDYNVTVTAYDTNDVKYAMTSQTFVVTKLESPEVESDFSLTNGGQILIKVDSKVKNYKLIAENSVVGKLEFDLANNGQDILTTLDFLKSGVYDISVISENNDVVKHYFRSDANEFGKVYKLPEVTLSGKVGNTENGSVFNLEVENSSVVESSLKVSSRTKSEIFNNFTNGISWTENQSGQYLLSAVLQSKSATSSIDGSLVYVINSNASEHVSLTKVGQVGLIMHKYDGNNSVLTFSEVDFADKNSYQLLHFNGTDFEVVEESKVSSITVSNKIVTIVLNGRVENIFDSIDNEFEFKIVAKTLDDLTAINSSNTKTLTLLGQPTAPETNNPQNGVFVWNTVANADRYRVEIYYTDKKAISDNGDLKLFEKSSQTVTTTQYEFTKVGYYVVHVYAVADTASENLYISSAVALERNFHISEKVTIGNVQLRDNGSSLFLRIFASDSNVETYTIGVTGQSDEILVASGEDYDDYTLNKNFFTEDTEIEVTVTANSNDATLRPSDSYVLTVEKLRNVTADDIEIGDDYGNSIVLTPYKTGITSKITYNNSKKTSSSIGNATLDISDLTVDNFELTFEFVGSDKNSGVYEIKDNKVYLTCDQGSKTISFSRIAQPDQLVYENGKFTYGVTNIPASGYKFILEISYTNNKSNFLISVKFDNLVTATATGNNTPITLGNLQNFLNTATNTIDFKAIEDAIYANQKLEACYRQMETPNFTMLVSFGQYDAISEEYIFSSRSSVETQLKKLPEAEIALEYIEADNNYKISWEILKDSSLEISNIEYKLYVNAGNTSFEEVTGFSVNYETVEDKKIAYLTLSANDYQAGVFYNFYLTASQPHYLGKSLSNNLIVYKLNSVDSLTLDQNTLKATVSDAGYAQKVVVTANGTSKDYTIANNGNVEIALDGEGEYKVQVVAKESIFNDVTGTTTYYVNSNSSKWTVSSLSTFVGENVPQLSFASEVVSWDKFAGNFGENLNYVLIFKDKNGVTAQTSNYTISGNTVSVELESNSQIYKDLARLSAGEIEIQVSAYLSSYSSNKNGVIYYADAQTLLNGNEEFNHYIYEKITSNKLAEPTISNVAFDKGTLNSKVEKPDITVTFEGDYDFQNGAGEDRFKVYLSSTGTEEKTQISVAISEKTTGVFEFTLVASDYAFVQPDETLIVEVLVTSDKNMPSTAGTCEIYMAKQVRSVEFETVLENGKEFTTQTVLVKFMDNTPTYTLGGVVLKITDKNTNKVYYLDYEVTTNDNTLSCDISDFVKTNLRSGANISVEAFVNSYSAKDNYILACKNAVGTDISENIIVLGGVATTNDYNESVSYNDIHYRADAGGFQILAPTGQTLSDDIVFVVSYKVGEYTFETKEITVDDEFYFEFPSSWTDEGEYSLDIYAKQKQTTVEGLTNVYVNSWINTLTFEIDRVAKISQVELVRDEIDTSEINITWNAVANVSEYMFRVYNNVNGKLIFTTTTTTTQNTLSELFWANYSDFENVNLTIGTTDIEAKFEIISVGKDGKSNSEPYTFFAYLRPNNLSYQSIRVDNDFGTVTLTTLPDYTYLYRFVAGSTVVQDWKSVKANTTVTTLDTSKLDIDASIAFNVEIIIMGSADTTGTTIASESTTNFVFDSYYWTSALSTIRFGKSNKILNVRYDESDASSIILEMGQGVRANLSKILVGLDENAVYAHNVIELELDKLKDSGSADGNSGSATNTTRRSYAYPLADMLAILKELGIDYSDGEATVYFWAFESEAGGLSYVISDSFGFDISLIEDTGFVKVDKLGSEVDPEDNANTFVLFNKNDNLLTSQTVGINVKIDYVKTTYVYDERGNIIDVEYSDETAYRFVNLMELTSLDYDYYAGQNYYVIDLTSIFEEDDFKDITGNISLEFLRVKYNLINQKFIVSDWSETYDFVRLAPITYATLNAGNIEWTEGDAVNAGQYYIYFYSVNEDGTKSDSYSRFSVTNQTVFDASKFGGANCFIEIQGVSADPYVLSSTKYEVSDTSVIKNQLSGELKLSGGSFTIDYDNVNGDATNNIYKFITENQNSELSFEERAKTLIETTWTYPFTFKLSSLLNGQVTMRLTFISNETNRTQSVDVDVKDLLINLAEFADNNDSYDIIEILEQWAQGATTESYKQTLNDFVYFIENGSHGVANDNILFDTYFEKIQSGQYSITYCLLGGTSSLNSTWMTFKNSGVDGENTLYVNGETTVRAKREEIDSVTNSYKVIIKKGQIYDYVNDEYVLVDADQYVLQIATKSDSDAKTYAFSVDNFSGEFRLHYLSSSIDTTEFDVSKSISVYQSDADGNRVAYGNYLMFYINQNDGDSLLGVFGDMIQRTIYGMQIYAVGNDYSLSGKSEYYRLTLLSFGDDFAISDGVLSWTTQLNRNITVMYKTSRGSEMTDEIVTENSYATYSLDGKGEGTYQYIKFVVTGGDVVDNNIIVDSDIYEIDNVYKLSSPRLTNYLGYLSIDESSNGNRARYNASYSDGSFYQYIIYNNNNEDVYIKRIDTTQGNSVEGNGAYLYVPGRDGDEDYRYKSTEVNAESFQVVSVGSTVENVKFIPDTSDLDANGYNKNYYIKKLDTSKWTNNLGNPLSSIALQSSISTIPGVGSLSARMLDSVSNLYVSNGKIVWTEVSGRTEDEQTLTIQSGAEIVYKVSIEQYSISKSDDNTNADYTEQVVDPIYTRNAEIDFADIEDKLEILDSDKQIFIKISVQALALRCQANRPNTSHVELISGGYAYGNVEYASTETQTFVLLSEINENSTLSQLSRLKSVTSLRVSDGQLQWTYSANNLPNGASLTVDSFDLFYKFIVEDENGNEILGTYEKPILQSDGSFLIKFNEDKGQMKVGNQKVKVFATTGANLDSSVIKSRGEEITINKLDTISSDDFSIEYVGSGVDMLDLSDYFKANINHEVIVTFYNMYGNLVSTTGNPFTLTNSRNRIYLISNADQAYEDEYNVIIDSISGGCNMTFKVRYNANGVLYSDVSDYIPLQRVEWQNSDTISWNSTTGEFTWTYSGYLSLNTGVEAEVLGYAVSRDTTLYTDADLTTPSDLENNTISNGTAIDIIERGSGYIKISYLGGQFYISDMFIDRVAVDTYTLSANTLLKVVEVEGDYSVIKVKDPESDADLEGLYRVLTTSISKPVYIIEADYRASGKRYYTTEEASFKPTIVGYVTLSIRVKLGPANIQSEVLNFNNGQYTMFNLFAGGDGTSTSPYRIANADQFRNIQYRMRMEDYLKSGEDDNSVNYFEILADIDLTDKPFTGVLFKGIFEGIINGNGHKISYKVTATDELTYSVDVNTGFVKSPISGVNSTTFLYGASLFERTSTYSSISNLRIDADYSDDKTVQISIHSLIAGLVISNYGIINNVELVGFNTNFSGYNPQSRPMMVYSGIASQNIGEQASISNCFVSTDMIIPDSGYSQVIFASGIAFINQTNAKITNCMTGYSGYTVDFDVANAIPTTNKIQVLSTASQNIIQIAGICITNANGTISGCQNNLEIDVQGISTALNCTVYIAGLVDYQGGTMSGNINNGTLNIPHGFGSCNYALNDSDFGTRVETTLI